MEPVIADSTYHDGELKEEENIGFNPGFIQALPCC